MPIAFSPRPQDPAWYHESADVGAGFTSTGPRAIQMYGMTGVITNGFIEGSFFRAPKSMLVASVLSGSGGTAAVGGTIRRIGVYRVADTMALTSLAGATVAFDATLWAGAWTQYERDFETPFWVSKNELLGAFSLQVGATTEGHLTWVENDALNVRWLPWQFGFNTAGGLSDLPASQTAGQMSSNLQGPWFALLP